MLLRIYTGCMGSGKSEALINEILTFPTNSDECDIYTFGKQPFIHSRNGKKVEAKCIENLDKMGSNKYLFIDECQFHYWTWVEWEKIIDRYEYIGLAGLDIMQDPIRHEFHASELSHGAYYYRFPFQVQLNKLVGKCDITGQQNATHSFRFRDAKDVRDRDNYVSLSEKEALICRLFTKDEYLHYKERYGNSKTNE